MKTFTAIAVVTGLAMCSGCLTGYVNTRAVESMRQNRRADAFAKYRAMEAANDVPAIRAFIAQDFLGIGMDVTRWDAVKAEPGSHLLGAALDIGLTVLAQDQYRRYERKSDNSGGINVTASDQSRVVIVTGDNSSGSSSGDSNTGSGGQNNQ